MVRAPAMSFVRSFLSYYRRNHRSLGTVTQYQGHCLLQQRSFSSANQRDMTKTSRSISAPQANPGPVTPPPSSGGPPIFTWMKLAIGSIFTILVPFLCTQWKNILKIGGEIEAAKEAVEKTAEVVEKVAEMAEKASEEVAEQLKDGKLKEAAEVVEHLSEKVEEDARMVEDIIHKVDEIEEDVNTMIEASKHDDGKSEHDENKPKDGHDEIKPRDN
ncbi:hypothetical protein FCM35_KLT08091 [Carex littledalei]|uniref:Uncharacterized protein n=1 Tax=Carex littledalei TaxID=544730 RepID=A0A833QQZ7_9POAL|nr:hypothetical protein FCM35_KLT08091 [Carex littledalei]